MRQRGRVVGVVVAVFLLAACASGGDEASLTVGAPGGTVETTVPGGATTPTPAPGSVQVACDALTVEEIANTVGNRVRAGTGAGRNCFWATAVDRGSSIFLSMTRPAPPQECMVQRNALAKELTQEPVSGVGSSAVWAWQQLTLLIQGTFLACWPNAIVALQITGEKDQAVLKNQASTLAQRVQSRL
jgi:hypothetical protein